MERDSVGGWVRGRVRGWVKCCARGCYKYASGKLGERLVKILGLVESFLEV